MCARLLLREVLMWFVLTYLLQSSLLTSRLKCLFIVPSKNKKHRGAALHMAGRGKRSGLTLRVATPPKAGRGTTLRMTTPHKAGCRKRSGLTLRIYSTQGRKRRGVTVRMATAPEAGSTKGEGSHSSCCGDRCSCRVEGHSRTLVFIVAFLSLHPFRVLYGVGVCASLSGVYFLYHYCSMAPGASPSSLLVQIPLLKPQ